MEAFGNLLFMLLIVIGLGLLVGGAKKSGLFLIGISIYFLHIAPNADFKKYKKFTEGIYRNENGKEIIIYDGKYEIMLSGKKISSGTVEYSNIDDYSFSLNPDQGYHSIGKGKIGIGSEINGEFVGEIYY